MPNGISPVFNTRRRGYPGGWMKAVAWRPKGDRAILYTPVDAEMVYREFMGGMSMSDVGRARGLPQLVVEDVVRWFMREPGRCR